MTTIICPVCAEAWNEDALETIDGVPYAEARWLFSENGCGQLFYGVACDAEDERLMPLSIVDGCLHCGQPMADHEETLCEECNLEVMVSEAEERWTW